MPRADSPLGMAKDGSSAGSVLLRNLVAAAVLGGGLFVLFTVFNDRLFHGLSVPELLLLEAGAIVLVGYLVSRAVTNATSVVMQRHGLVPRGHAVRLFLNVLIATGTVLALFKLAGVSLESIYIGAGFAGIVLGLASQTVLSNVFAGILLVFADPFRPGDRVSLIGSQYGMLAPSYPHEAMSPAYSGTVEDVGLTYTIVALDGGGLAKVPNGVVLLAMVIVGRGAVVHRVRMTLPFSVPIAELEAALPEVVRKFPPPFPGAPPPRLEAADISATTWDAVVVLWSEVRDAAAVRDQVLRAVLPHLGPTASA